MKKFLHLFLAVFIGFSLNAQITINSNNIVDVGDEVYQAFDTIPDATIVPGSAGASQVWDFSALTIDRRDTMTFVNPASTPYDTSFVGDNVAMFMSENNGWAYLNKSSSNLEMIGMVGEFFAPGSLVAIEMNPGETIMQFPFTYTGNFIDNSQWEILVNDTVKVIQILDKTVEADAWGSMTTLLGTYDVLRIFSTIIETQEIYSDSLGNWVLVQETVNTSYHYEWWTDDVAMKFPLASFSWDIDSMSVDGEVEFLENIVISVPETNVENISIYPNPTNGNISIQAENIERVEVLDMQGRTVNQFTINNTQCAVNLSDNPKGIYFIKVTTDKGVVVEKIVLE